MNYITGEFKSPKAAMQFILRQPALMKTGGFEANELAETDIKKFASELLEHYKNLSYKYKYRKTNK